MKTLNKIICLFTIFALLCVCIAGCAENKPTETPSDPILNSEPASNTNNSQPHAPDSEEIDTDLPTPDETEDTPAAPVSISTTGGVVVVGTVGNDENGWFLTPEHPLNVEFHYFLDNPSQFEGLTRIHLFDASIDGIDKVLYLGRTVTIEGSFRFYRDAFDKLFLLPYSICMGKTVPESYAAPDLQPPDLTQSRYDPSIPLPQRMDPVIQNGQFIYNAFMLSQESLELMGNEFAVFYCDFVDAFLSYKAEVPCPSEEFAEMLSTIIYFEFPLYDVCAEPFEFTKHYDPTAETVTIAYKYDATVHQQKIDEFMSAANAFLSTTAPDQSEAQLAKNIYHELCSRVTYDDSALVEIQRKNAYYAYMNHSGVCVTFANVYNQLLTQVGIRATTAQCDYTPTMGHVWSLITIDGIAYFCDPTFELNFLDGTAYAYFGQTYAQRLADGLGQNGITAGRYYPYTVDESMLSATPFAF